MDTPCSVTADLRRFLATQEDMIPSVYNSAYDIATATLVNEAMTDEGWIGDAVNEPEVLEAIMNLLNGMGREPEQVAGLAVLTESAIRKTLERYLAPEIEERACDIYSQVLNTGEK